MLMKYRGYLIEVEAIANMFVSFVADKHGTVLAKRIAGTHEQAVVLAKSYVDRICR